MMQIICLFLREHVFSPCASSLEEFQRYLTGPEENHSDCFEIQPLKSFIVVFSISKESQVPPQPGRLLELAGEGGNLPTQVRVQAGRRGPEKSMLISLSSRGINFKRKTPIGIWYNLRKLHSFYACFPYKYVL